MSYALVRRFETLKLPCYSKRSTVKTTDYLNCEYTQRCWGTWQTLLKSLNRESNSFSKKTHNLWIYCCKLIANYPRCSDPKDPSQRLIHHTLSYANFAGDDPSFWSTPECADVLLENGALVDAKFTSGFSTQPIHQWLNYWVTSSCCQQIYVPQPFLVNLEIWKIGLTRKNSSQMQPRQRSG